MSEKNLAFDLTAYSSTDLQEGQKLKRDLLAVSRDAQPTESRKEPFVTPFTYLVDLERKKVVCLEYDSRDVREVCGYSPDMVAIGDQLLDRNNYFVHQGEQTIMGLWISGPDYDFNTNPKGYKDSRVGAWVGKMITPGIVEVKNYSGLNTELSEQECFNLASWVSNFGPNPGYRPDSIAELRNHPVTILCPDYADPWEWLCQQILLEPVLSDYITSGEADRKYHQDMQAIGVLVKTATDGLLAANTEWEAIWWGAWMETSVMDLFSIVLDGRVSGCGLLNRDLYAQFGQSTTVLLSKSHSETTVCNPIKCPSCGWRPSESQLQEISVGSLICCPDCRYNPSTRTKPAEYSQSIVIETPKLEESTITQTYNQNELLSNWTESVSEEISLPWSIYFFNPELEPDLFRTALKEM